MNADFKGEVEFYGAFLFFFFGLSNTILFIHHRPN